MTLEDPGNGQQKTGTVGWGNTAPRRKCNAGAGDSGPDIAYLYLSKHLFRRRF